MDFLPQKNSRNKSKRKRSGDSLLKVVYISSPMKVKTSASRFRTLVQELTGRDSDISRFMDTSSNVIEAKDFEILPDNYRLSNSSANKEQNQHQLSSFPVEEDPHRDSPTSSDSLLEQPPSFSDLVMNEQYYQGMLTSDFFNDSSELDVLGSYDAL